MKVVRLTVVSTVTLGLKAKNHSGHIVKMSDPVTILPCLGSSPSAHMVCMQTDLRLSEISLCKKETTPLRRSQCGLNGVMHTNKTFKL